jgi:hypothetical protein
VAPSSGATVPTMGEDETAPRLTAGSNVPAIPATREPGATRPRLAPLDVHFISSLPVTQGTVYKAWVDSKPVQMVWGVD